MKGSLLPSPSDDSDEGLSGIHAAVDKLRGAALYGGCALVSLPGSGSSIEISWLGYDLGMG